MGIRLRSEYDIIPDKFVANASLLYQKEANIAMKEITTQYIDIARAYQLPMMLMTPTRRAGRQYDRVKKTAWLQSAGRLLRYGSKAY